jgi:Na+/proline symporter/signal transduction histidine kinase/CheY-like chemotaxis protein
MINGWIAISLAFLYIILLFGIARYGDYKAKKSNGRKPSPTRYALTLAVFCTSWTFFGSVGFAARNGLDFITVYLGPILFITIGAPILKRIVRLAKSERTSSVSDFMSARYGKSERVAALATFIAAIAVIPYIALQLKAVSTSVELFIDPVLLLPDSGEIFLDIAIVVSVSMGLFAILFGTRHIDATEHQEGLMLAVAFESVVKLFAFIIVGVFVTWGIFDGPADLFREAGAVGAVDNLTRNLSGGTWIVMTALSLFAIILLPRQFHVAVVENNNDKEIDRAQWLFPLYLIGINIFVVPIALAGYVIFGSSVDADAFVLSLPIAFDQGPIALIGFLGGLSAATAMVIVATVALAIMISNDLIMPVLLRFRSLEAAGKQDLGRILLLCRRFGIIIIIVLAYFYYRYAGSNAALASIGLLSFAAIAQLAPAFFGGLLWKRGTAKGAFAGMSIGFLVWGYTLLLPAFVKANLLNASILTSGPWGIQLLNPQELLSLSFDPLTHGVFWSLLLNTLAYIGVSLMRTPEAIERLQANIFVPTDMSPTPSMRMLRTKLRVDELQKTVARYLGAERAAVSFQRYAIDKAIVLKPEDEADLHLLRYSEQILASAIGSASSRIVLSLLLKRHETSPQEALKLLDDVTAAIQYNRDILQTAIDQVGQGIGVFDANLNLICWNMQFIELLDLPHDYGQVGTSLNIILRTCAENGVFGDGKASEIVDDRIEKLVVTMETFHERVRTNGTILEVKSHAMPGGGIVTTFSDITERIETEQALARSNETLERRVKERTLALQKLNDELQEAKGKADEANLSKTRFLAAAGHDILQPLNAARLYTTSLVEGQKDPDQQRIAHNVEAALGSVEEILGAVLDISRLDAGALQAEFSPVHLDDIFSRMAIEFEPMARKKRLQLRIVKTTAVVRSDRRLLRRLLQNLISNALKYTTTGKVLVGVRHMQGKVRVDVYDTGVGIPDHEKQLIFQEFQRLESGAKVARGLGLGLSIVERIGRVLDLTVDMDSIAGKGSCFSVTLPLAPNIPKTMSSKPVKKVASSQIDGMLICCIDNEPAILDGMRLLLERWNCKVITAPDQKVAEEKIRESGIPDVVLIDYHLDDGTGLEAVVKMRWKLGEDLPFILITADRSIEVRTMAEERNVLILNKPVKPAALRALLTKFKPASRTAAE